MQRTACYERLPDDEVERLTRARLAALLRRCGAPPRLRWRRSLATAIAGARATLDDIAIRRAAPGAGRHPKGQST